MTLVVNSRNKAYLTGTTAMVFALVFFCDSALADGLDKVNTFMDTLLSILRAISVAAVTIAVMFIGYKMIFHQARFQDCIPVVLGCLLIGGASELAHFLLE
jgi:type IV secretory pathway VirB2 component (pilin)